MAERCTLGLAHQLLDLLRENQEQPISLEHARLLVNLARALVRPQDAQEDISGDYETEIALDLPGAALEGPSSPALVETAEPGLRSDIFDAAVTSTAHVKTPQPRKDQYEMDTLVAAPATSSLEHLVAPTRSTYQPPATVNTEHGDSFASLNPKLSTSRTLDDSSAQNRSLDAPFPPPVVVVTTTSALVQPPKCAESAELEPNVVPTLYSGHQHIPAPGAASITIVSPRSRDDAAHTKTELTESAALPPAIPFTELSPLAKEEETPILLLAKYPPPLPLHNHERASASPPAWVKTEPVDSPVLSSLPIGPGDETNASALPIPNFTYSPPSEVYQTHVKIEPVDSPALFSLPSSIASVRRPLVTTAEEGDSSIPSSVPLENATAPRVLVKTEPNAEDALAAMLVPSAQKNTGLHSPSLTTPSVIYHYSDTQHAPAKAEPVDAFIPDVQPSPMDAGSTPIIYSIDYMPSPVSTPASPSVKAEHEDVDLAHEQEPLSSLAPSTAALYHRVKAEPVDPSIPSTYEADTPILRLAKYPPTPTPTPVNDDDVHTTHMPSVPSSLVTAGSPNAARNHSIPVHRQSPSMAEQTTHEIASATAAAVENAAYIPILQQSPTTPGDSLPGQTVLEILSAPSNPSPSSEATSATPAAHALPRVVHVESEALANQNAPSILQDTQDQREASTAPSSNLNADADADAVDTDPTSTRSPSPSACSIAPPMATAAPPSHTSNSPATSAGGYANVFMLVVWSDDETSPVNAQQQDIFPPVPPPTPASSSPTSASPSPNVPRSLSSSHAAPVLPLQTNFPTDAEAAYDAEAPMDVDEGAASHAYEGAGAETEEQEEQQHVPRLLLRMSSPVPVPAQAQHDDDGPAHEARSSEVQDLDADGCREAAAQYVPSLLHRMSSPGHDNSNNADATEQQGEHDSAPSTSDIFSGRASLRSRFDIPPPSLPLSARIIPPVNANLENDGPLSFKRRHREDGMEDGGSAVGRSGSKRRRRK